MSVELRRARLLKMVHGSLEDSASPDEYHRNLLGGLRSLVGCDGALYRPGSSWAGSRAYYLDADSGFTDGYVHGAARYRPEVTAWCELTKGEKAVIDTELYSASERRKKALYSEVIRPAGIKSIMGCPLTVGKKVVALIFMYRTGMGRAFHEDQARSLDPILKGLALAELAFDRRESQVAVRDTPDTLPDFLHSVFQELLTGKSEKQIAALLGLSPRTVHKYTELIYRSLNIHSRAELMARMLAR